MAKRRGTNNDDTLTGTNGADTIYGLDGDDRIDPRLGADRIFAGAGNDTIVFTSVMTSFPPPEKLGRIDGGSGFDTIDLRSVSPTFLGGRAEQLTLTVGTQTFEIKAVEQVLLGANNSGLYLPLFYTGPQLTIRAGDGADYFQGSGNFPLYGEGGDDRFFIGGVFGTTTRGVIDGGDGYDTVELINATTLDLSAGVLRSGDATYTVAGIEEVVAYADSVVIGSDRNDRFSVRDLFDHPDASVTYSGRGGRDDLSGSQGGDTIDGGFGVDVLRGRAGGDTLTGGAGADLFVYEPGDSTATDRDRITDFQRGQDRIDLSAIDGDPSTPRLDKLDFIGRAAFSGEAGELRFGPTGKATVIEADLDGDRIADLSILLDGRHVLGRSDFVFVAAAADPFGVG